MMKPRGTSRFLLALCISIGVAINSSQGADDFYFIKPGGGNDFWSSSLVGSRSSNGDGSSDIVSINDGGFKKTVLDGEKRVTLECAVSDTRNIQYYWTLNGIRVDNTTRRHQIGPNLYFSRIIREHDSGEFACIAVNSSSGFSLTSPRISFNIVWISPHTLIHLAAPEKAAEIRPGIEVILRCRVEGTGDISFEWFRNGDPVRASERLVIRGKRIHIKNVSTSVDSGSYTCKARNDAGESVPGGMFVVSVLDEKYPKLLVSPQDAIIKQGEAAMFHCVLNTSKAESTQWFFHDNGPLGNSSRYVLFANGSLLIHRASAADEGIYKCLVASSKFPEEEPQIYAASLRIAFMEPLSSSTSLDPAPLIPSHKLAVPEKGTVEIFCERPKGLPTPKLWWEGPDGRVILETSSPVAATASVYAPSSSYMFSSARIREPNTLLVTNVRAGGNYNYACVAENMYSSTRANVQLVVVTTPPTILGHPSSTVVKEGEPAYFMCQFRGPSYPVSQIQWLRNKVPIPARTFLTQDDQADGPILYPVVSSSIDGGSTGGGMGLGGGSSDQQKPFTRFVSFPENGTLKIEPVELTDVGDYTCEIMTPGYMTVESRPAQLFVTETLKFMPKPVDRKLELGSTSKIHCKAHGASPLKIRWVKEGQSIFEWPSHIKEVNGTLHFHTVKKTDKGRYTCVATNAEGLINTTIYVDVGVYPKFSVVPKNPTEVVEGKTVMIDCKAYGDPLPTIQWDKNNIMNGFDRDRFRVLENGSLLVTEVVKEDDGRYGCTAGNSGGFIREEVRLIVKSNDQYYSESLDDAVMTKTVSITLSVAVGYMLLVIGLMLWCRHRQLKRKQAYLTELEKENGDEEMKDSGPISNGSAPLLVPVPNGHRLTADSCRESVKSDGETGKSTHSSIGGKIASATASIASHKSVLSQHSKRSGSSGYELISYPRQDLQFVMLLGHGDFGEVFLAKAKHIVKDKSNINNDNDKEMLVMVKALQTREESALFEYKREIDMYYKLSHENVTKLVKLCRDMDPHYMLLEYSDWGDLKQFLLATRKDNPRKVPKPPPLTISQVLQVISQVALGMEHISNYRFVHKDLATRNCLISSGLKIQVSNPSLCRDTYASEYHKFRNQYVPIRWLPSEAILEDDYSTKTDIWSFACLVWEVLHQAAIPLSHLSNEKVIECLERKDVLWDPVKVQSFQIPQRLQQLLIQCWDTNPKNRPSFSSIVILLSEISKESLLNNLN